MKETKIKQVKKGLRANKNLKNYIFVFKNKQMRFLFTEISIIFDSSMSNSELLNIELSNSNNPTQDNFVKNLESMSKTFDNQFCNLDWSSLGVAIWYSFQMSLYYNNKRKSECIFTESNYIKLNHIKKFEYSKWLKSFYETNNSDFNGYVKKILKRII